MVSPQLLLQVEVPVGVEVAAGPECAEAKDGFCAIEGGSGAMEPDPTGKAKDDSSSTTSKRDPGATNGTSEKAAATEKAAPPSEFDAIGAEKDWGSIHATLKEAGVKGSVGTASILLKNTEAKEDNISSLMQLQMTNEEGDRGEMDMMNTSCDGKIPPNGLLKCKLAYKFDKPPKELTIALGTGLGAQTVYFKVKAATPAAPTATAAATGKTGKAGK